MKKLGKNGFLGCWLVSLLGVLMTLTLAWAAHYHNQYRIKQYTAGLAEKTEMLIASRFQHYEYGLAAARAMIVAVGGDKLTRQQFKTYSQSRKLDKEFPGSLGFGFIRRVPVAQEVLFIEQARADDAPNFSIRSLSPHDEDRFVIQYIYPVEQNSQAVGLDIGSESNRRAAALSAARHDRPFLTAPITLVQADRKPRKGALALLPIYADGVKLETNEARENAVIGWSYTPLIIDDVLSHLEDLTDHAFVSLTNKTETSPFYKSTVDRRNSDPKNSLEYPIFVLGQHWKMQISPSLTSIKHQQPWNISFIIILGLLLTTSVLYVINLLRFSERADNENRLTEQVYKVGFDSLAFFIKTPQVKRVFLFIAVLLFLIGVLICGLLVNNHINELKHTLRKSNDFAHSKLQAVSEQYKKDVLFLAKASPLLELKSLQDDIQTRGTNVDMMQLQEKYDRISNIFKAYMLANTNVYQVRLIGAHDDWQERVKVQRIKGVPTEFKQDALQSKQHETYIAQTLQVGSQNIFMSAINLNREFGKIEQPHRPVWRFSMPLFHADGRPFAIIVININADTLLKSLVIDTVEVGELYVTNDESDYLLQPNLSKTFTFQYGEYHRWKDEFKLETWFGNSNLFELVAYTHPLNDIFAIESQFLLGGGINERWLNLYNTSSQVALFSQIAVKITILCLFLLLLFIVAFTIHYGLWLTQILRNREMLNSQKEAQQEKERLRFKGLLESSPDVTIVINEAGNIQMVNAQAVQMFGYERSEIEGKSIDKLIPLQHRKEYKHLINRYMCMQEGKFIANKREVIALRSDGIEIPVEVSLSSVNVDEKLLITASLRDITLRLKEEEKLNKALSDAKLATEAKSAFLANTSHEIRTPLNAIIGLSYLLSEEALTVDQQQLVSKIELSGKSLLGIVNDVLDLAKIEANEMPLEQEPFDLSDFIEEVCSIFAVQAEAKNITFNVQLSPDLPDWVAADITRLRQILVNLLSNALKFTEQGTIHFNAEVISNKLALYPDKKIVRISVTDTGIGISEEAKTRLFKPFNQSDSSTARRFGGTGIGLSIVHQLVELMEGKIGLESEHGVGSKFSVELPLTVPTEDQIVAIDNLKQTLFVIIAEDDPSDANQLQKIVQSLGWRAQLVSNGSEMVDVYIQRREKNLRPPDALIVDWKMPVMDGIHALSKLSSIIGRENLPAVLMISSSEKEDIVANDKDKLINHYLAKPVNASSLFNVVNEVVTLHTGNSQRVLQSSRTDAVKAKWLPNIHILVVDDRPINLTVISNILQHNGAVVDTANSGEEALTLLADKTNDFDAVLMDIQMPGIDGLEATRQVRNELGLSKLPIIALTAGALVEEKNRALAAGMDDFLTKPVNPTKIINVLRNAIEKYRDKEIPIASLKLVQSEEGDFPTITGLNIDKAKQIMQGDKELFLKALASMLADYENLASPIENPNSSKERLTLASQMHKLRSVSGMLGAEEIYQLATQAEQLLHSEDEPVGHLLIPIRHEFKALQQASETLLASWKEAKKEALSNTNNAPDLQPETLKNILTLLEEQDMSALAELELHSASLRKSLGGEDFERLQTSLDHLNFGEAVVLLAPLNKTIG
ncbi:CHASE domain-containing protein [Psychromonas sp. psych-6C06]|uniref:CHASE domain-containing protein n=1 Tax=Psychromonas sp. psych-6C06 TaxID=2058089 RepID=UPI00187C04A2|nr:CHASE domain-containing protein [Psychromonas sp. psych-6C06]